jgi:hypothetical protein
MTRSNLRLLPFVLLAGVAGCVSLEQVPMTAGSVQSGQRTVVIVYPSPGPVMSERDSMTEQAAKVVPGLGFVIKAAQNRRDLGASQDLQRSLPGWQPEALFYPALRQELAASGFPGRLVSPAEAGLSETALRGFNRADDVNDWQVKYFVPDSSMSGPTVSRNYGAIPALADALVLEVNLAYCAPSDGDGHWTPTLSAVTKLYRASDMKLLWRQEDTADDKLGLRRFEEFKKDPADLIAKYQKLMPALAQSVGGSLRAGLQQAGMYVSPPPR